MHADAIFPEESKGMDENEPLSGEPVSRTLVRLKKPVIIGSEPGKTIDTNVVSARFFNCFNYSLLPQDAGTTLSVGITSANAGEGKTLVAANLAVSLATANQRETILVDCNVRNPQLHMVFGTAAGPGLVDSFYDGAVHLCKTRVRDLYVLSAGGFRGRPAPQEKPSGTNGPSPRLAPVPSLQLEHLAAFRDVLYTLKEQFDFVIVDLPSIQENVFPLLFTNQLDGVLVVVNVGRTKQEDVEAVFRRLNQRQVLGFVLNRAGEDALRGQPGQ